jgi:hypothetical protein
MRDPFPGTTARKAPVARFNLFPRFSRLRIIAQQVAILPKREINGLAGADICQFWVA